MFGGIPNAEIDALASYWAAFPTLRAQLFASNDTPYSALSAEDVKQAIADNADVQHFINRFNTAFASLPAYLKEELIDNVLTLKVQQQENKISIDIFSRLSDIPLIDKYQAYQLLDDQWIKTATDLEIIQTEGFEATKVVEPNMVIKKKDGKDEEVQDGWQGRVIPFELVQLTLLRPQYDELKQAEADLEKTLSEKDELLEKLIETGEGENLLNDDNTAFVAKEITKEAKTLNKTKAKYAEDTLEHIIVTTDALMAKEKKQKKAVKDQTAELHTITKIAIENFTDNDVLFLLTQKWIVPLCTLLAELPEGIINDLVAKTKALAEKYAITYMDLDREIRKAEQSLSSLIDDLEGSEFDMLGLKELQTLLGANNDEKE
jgi:type I restriction enzyme M protein